VEAKPQATPLSLTFRGAPVEGTRSIDATFASEAVRSFVEATEMIKSSLENDLAEVGRVPNKDGRSLRIVDTAVGSFGFELELPPRETESQTAMFSEDDSNDPYAEAIELTLNIIEKASTEEEDELTELIAEIHPRALTKARAFLEVLQKNKAFLGVSFNDKQLRLEKKEQIERVVAALAENDISEIPETHIGTLIGLLPKSRQFEAQIPSMNNNVIKGIIDRKAIDSDHELKAIRSLVDKEAKLEFRVVRVRTRTRYVLTNASQNTHE
jgi:hypothetical protein